MNKKNEERKYYFRQAHGMLLMILFLLFSIAEEVFSACDPPVITNYTNREIGSITVNWVNLNFNDAWEIEIVKENEIFTGVPNTPLILTNKYTFTGLEGGTEYCFRIRGICDGEPGPWKVPFCFITAFTENSTCGLGFELQDPIQSQAYVDNHFYFISEDYQDAKLGEEVFIQDVRLIIDHNWPSDLELFLSSPSGKKITLSDKQGFNSNDYGNPEDTDCDSVALFSDDACSRIEDMQKLEGEFRPEQSFNALYDGSPLEGPWILTIRDHNPGHQGVLEYFMITLAESACRLPETLFLEPADPGSCQVIWDANGTDADSIFIEFGPGGFIPGMGTTIGLDAKLGEFLLEGLNTDQEYDLYFRSKCDSEYSVISCFYPYETECNEITLRENFEYFSICELNCEEQCQVSELWFNAINPANQWLVNQGETSTDGTGPQGDVSGFGKYVYMESSENNCGLDPFAILETDCLEIMSNADGCDMSFYYNMNGADIGSLTLQVTVNDGQDWETLVEINGDQGSHWHRQFINLQNFGGMVGRFRFVAQKLNDVQGERGDIALDELIFYGSKPVVEAQYLFYLDQDSDNYGAPEEGIFFCSNTLLEGYSRNDLDCNDLDASVNPDSPEIPCNSIDENCNGMADDLDLTDPIKVKIGEIKGEACAGSNDAFIIPIVSGGVGPYHFLWSNGSQDSILTSIGEGKYSCLVEDQLGCLADSDTVEITSSSPIIFHLDEKSIISCKEGKDGYIHISHEGGLPPFQYLWSNGDTTQNIEGLLPGSYQLTITDSNGCQLISPVIELMASSNFTVGLQINPPLCHGSSDGSMQIIGVQGGESPFTYAWSTGDSVRMVGGLASGYYQLTVSDASFCYEVIDSIFIMDPDPLYANVVAKDDVSCFGDDDGAIEINAYGGVAPFTFHWTRNGQIYSTKDDLYNLIAGKYHLILRDNNGCEYSADTLVIDQPTPIEIGLDTVAQATCTASADGSIFVHVSGGSGDYQYFWNGVEEGIDSYQNLNPGLYNLVVTDKYGCKGFRSGIRIDALNIPLQASFYVIDPIDCFGEHSGIAKVVVEGNAKLPIDYNWSAGKKRIRNEWSDTLSMLPSGSYNVTVTDSKGCVGVTAWQQISQPAPLAYQVKSVNEVRCAGDYSGSIEIALAGGIPPYQVFWNTGKTGYKIKDLTGGNYFGVVYDYNNCFLPVDTIFVFEPDSLSVLVSSVSASPGMGDGSATVIPSGGVTPYSFAWDENTGFQYLQTAEGLFEGEYFVTVTDFNSCKKEVVVYVGSDVKTTATIPPGIQIFPNPAYDKLIIDLSESGYTILSIELSDLMGNRIRKFKPIDSDQKTQSIPLTDLPGGMYILNLETDRISVQQQIIILH